MRHPQPRSLVVRVAAIAAALAVGLAACSSTAGSGWTFAPEPSVTPAPSASGSGVPSGAPGSAGASGSAAAGASNPVVSSAPGSSPNPGGSNPSGGGTTGESTVRVVALNIAFDTPTIQAPAGQAFAIEFDNQDQGIPHNIEIKDPSGASVFKGDLVTGPAKTTYQVAALTKGVAYTFMCDVHPTMTGTVTVQ